MLLNKNKNFWDFILESFMYIFTYLNIDILEANPFTLVSVKHTLLKQVWQ